MSKPVGFQLGCTLGEITRRAVERFADREALVLDGRRVSYRQMGERISQYVQVLESRGLGRGDAICQLGGNRPEALMLRLAAQLRGMRYTPLHPLGSVEDHAFIVEDSEATALVVDAEFGQRGAELAERAAGARHLLSLGAGGAGEDLVAAADGATPRPLVDEGEPEDITLLVYTGGTTGRPKGIVHGHSTIIATVVNMLAEYEWPIDVRLLVATPISHAAGSLVPLAFAKGGSMILQDQFAAAAFLGCIEKERVTVTMLVPTMIYRLLDDPAVATTDLSSLQLLIYGSSPMSPTRLEEALAKLGPIFVQLYGLSEAPNTVTTLNTWDHDPAQPEKLASCGYPVLGMEVKLFDDDDREVPVGEVGEICVRGPVVMEGYWKRSDETAKALRGGWLHTGDMARRDESGLFYIVDRKKDMIISGGFNVYPKEVEDTISRHPAVALAAVIGVPDTTWGEKVTAVVTVKEGMEVTADELMKLVKEQKGSVQAPKAVELVDAIPLTPIGKPDKKALRARYWPSDDRQVH